MATCTTNRTKGPFEMNTSNISRDIFRNAFWIWIHLGTAILLNATIYSSFRVLGYSGNLSLIISVSSITVCILIPTLFFSEPSQTKARFYWAGKLVYQSLTVVMIVVCIQNIYLAGLWIILTVSVRLVFRPPASAGKSDDNDDLKPKPNLPRKEAETDDTSPDQEVKDEDNKEQDKEDKEEELEDYIEVHDIEELDNVEVPEPEYVEVGAPEYVKV